METIQPRYNEQGLIPAIVQDAGSQQVLMIAWMNAEALALTLQTGQVHFWSRSRNELWRKGATSGNTLGLVDLFIDCDEDALLVTVHPAGPACHSGKTSCFYRKLNLSGKTFTGENA
jgi:phosphoribosyl-AMP cyclohydrolase